MSDCANKVSQSVSQTVALPLSSRDRKEAASISVAAF